MAAIFTLLMVTAGASAARAAEPPLLKTFCTDATPEADCGFPEAMAVDSNSGDLYVTHDDRVSKFSAWGIFERAWGGGVVTDGSGNVPADEVQKLTITATAGTFKLGFDPSEDGLENSPVTTALPYNASPLELQTALEELPNVEVGDVSVSSSNPGGAAGVPGGPYVVAYQGQFADKHLPALMLTQASGGFPEGGLKVTPIVQGAGSAEICTGTNCRSGIDGEGPGQFSGLRGIAVDSQGDVYTYESLTCTSGVECDEAFHPNRVQKFDSEGNFLYMLGRDVNLGGGSPASPGDICTAQHLANGDTCGGGIRGSGDGEFGLGGGFVGLDPAGNSIAVGPNDDLYVGGNERIQVFDSSGAHLRTIVLPGETVSNLAIDNAPDSPSFGTLYATFYTDNGQKPPVKANVRKLDPQTGAAKGVLDMLYPEALSLDSRGNVFAVEPFRRDGNGFVESEYEIVKFSPGGQRLVGVLNETGEKSRAIATSDACGVSETAIFLLRNATFSFAEEVLELYGGSPDPSICPPPAVPPSINAQLVKSADSGGATLRARINPHFWPDTRYYVQYGTEKCSEGGCEREKPVAPGALLSNQVFDADRETADVFLEGLESNTTYHYRFVAASGGGGPVFGNERTFRTLPLDSETGAACPNRAFRVGLAARLPDCRAYELVSPLDKNNGDISPVSIGGYFQIASDGGRVTYVSNRAFGAPGAAPLASQYLAERREGEGWLSRSISPPRDSLSYYPNGGSTAGSQYKAFSDDLCDGWVLEDTGLPLVPNAPLGVANLYQRELCGEDAYDLLSVEPPPGFGFTPLNSYYYIQPQGFSTDGARTFFRADAALAVEDGGPVSPFLCEVTADPQDVSYRWLRDGEPIAGAAGATYAATPDDRGTVVQCQVTLSSSDGSTVATSEAFAVAPLALEPAPHPGYAPERGAPPGAPTLSGTPVPGETLTCTPGPWKNSPTFTYRWLRNGATIAGATSASYPVQAADKGTGVQCELVGSNGGGSAVATSSPVLVEAPIPASTVGPTVTGTPSAGQTLSCDPGAWSFSPTFAYQWLRNGANIAGATASTYTLVAPTDEGKSIQCRVLATNGDDGASAVSERVVISPPPATSPASPTSLPSATGDAEVGETLTCDPGTWSGSPNFAFRWLRNGGNITPPKTASTYLLDAADLGKSIQCQVVAANAGGGVQALSAPRYVAPVIPEVPRIASMFHRVYVVSDGALRLVSVLPSGAPAVTSSSVGTPLGAGGEFRNDSVYGAVSADGSRVFWSTRPTAETHDIVGGSNAEGPGKLFLRLNATEPQSEVDGGVCTEPLKACTIPISEDPGTQFVAATPEGTRVLYTAGQNLYEAEIEATGGSAVAAPSLIATGVRGTMGASKDTQRVYFGSTEVLTGSQQNSNGDEAQAGQPNLYLYDKGVGFRFIGTLSANDVFSVGGSSGATPSPIERLLEKRSSRVTADGLAAAFVSTASLTGYDNIDRVSGQPDGEVYLYSATAEDGPGRLICASCNPSEARPVGRQVAFGGSGAFQLWMAAELPGWLSQFRPGDLLSENGKRLFFDSYDSLVPGDGNGRKDVYEWEAPGEGDCTEQSSVYSDVNQGCVSLISSGQSPQDSELVDATPTGSDVTFLTQASLVPQDYGLRDIYDARVNGGFAPPSAPPPSCEGEACQGTPEAPNDPTPASSAFQGAGNVRQGVKPSKPRCGQGKARKKGRCVKKKAKKKPAKQRANNDRRAGR